VSTGLARNWWAVGLRGLATIIFGLIVILLLPSSTTASFVMLFAAYVAADGCFAILAAILAAKGRATRWWTLILEGLTGLVLAGWVLVWPAIAVVPFLHALSIWAIVSGAFMLAAARRLSRFHGRWILALGGGISTGWGSLLATIGPDITVEPRVMAAWLIGYAVLFGATLMVLGVHLRRRHRQARSSPGRANTRRPPTGRGDHGHAGAAQARQRRAASAPIPNAPGLWRRHSGRRHRDRVVQPSPPRLHAG
jgi:uncharacterized membrane protein HdeD (DUF308 family)